MKAILAIDTSSGSTGVALAVDGRVLASSVAFRPYRHSENLFERIEEVLKEAALDKGALTGVAVTNGPGSFTGLRVGLATAKGLAYGLNVPLAGVSSLKAQAEPEIKPGKIVAPLFDAKKNQIYAAAFDHEGKAVIPENAWHPEDFAAALEKLDAPVILLGSGLKPFGGIFAERLGEKAVLAPPEKWNIDPAAVARLGMSEFEAGRMTDPALVKPVYLRLSEAEENALRRRADGVEL